MVDPICDTCLQPISPGQPRYAAAEPGPRHWNCHQLHKGEVIKSDDPFVAGVQAIESFDDAMSDLRDAIRRKH